MWLPTSPVGLVERLERLYRFVGTGYELLTLLTDTDSGARFGRAIASMGATGITNPVRTR